MLPGLRSPCTTTPGTSPGSVRSRAAAVADVDTVPLGPPFEQVGPARRRPPPSRRRPGRRRPGASCSARATSAPAASWSVGLPLNGVPGTHPLEQEGPVAGVVASSAGSAVAVPGTQPGRLVAGLVVREHDLQHDVAADGVARGRRPARRTRLERGTQDQAPALRRTGDQRRAAAPARPHRPACARRRRARSRGSSRAGTRRGYRRRAGPDERSRPVRTVCDPLADRCARRGAPPGEGPGGTR